MTKLVSIIAAVIYIVAGLQFGGIYHAEAEKRCYTGLYVKSMIMITLWPLMSGVINELENGCEIK